MTSITTSPSTQPADTGLSSEAFLKAFDTMLLARVLDEKFSNLYRGGKIHGGVFLGKGQEAFSVAIGQALQPGDVFGPLIRDQAGRLAFGESVLDAVRTYMGSPLGPMRARDGNVHRGRPRDGLLPMISHLGSMLPVVAGTLFARKLKGEAGTVGATCIGDGGTSTGAFHEGLNLAAVEKLPLVVLIANNQYAYSTPNDRQFACSNLIDKAIGYGVAGHTVDGTDLADCLIVVSRAVEAARNGGGPQIVVGDLLRLAGHGEHDTAEYVSTSLKSSPIGRDCLDVASEQAIEEGWLTADEIEEKRKKAMSLVNEVVISVQKEGAPDPWDENWNAYATPSLVSTEEEAS